MSSPEIDVVIELHRQGLEASDDIALCGQWRQGCFLDLFELGLSADTELLHGLGVVLMKFFANS